MMTVPGMFVKTFKTLRLPCDSVNEVQFEIRDVESLYTFAEMPTFVRGGSKLVWKWIANPQDL